MSALLLLVATATVSTSTSGELYGPRDRGPVVPPEKARTFEVAPGVEPEDVFLFVPRALLFPIEWTLTAVFWPIERLLFVTEKYAVIEQVKDVLYNDARTAGVLPVVTYFPGAGFSGGARAFHDDLFGHDESVLLSARFGGLFLQSYNLELSADRLQGSNTWLEAQVRYEVEPKLHFFGIGPVQVNDAREARFSQERVLGRFRIGKTFGELGERVKVGTSLIYNHRRFGEGHRLGSDERSIEEVYDTAELIGFREGVDLLEMTGDLVVDFRNHEGFPSSGAYLELFAGGVPPQGEYHFVHWGAEAAFFFDFFRQSRVLAVRAGVEAVDGEEEHIPFSELPRLGGPNLLRGYVHDTFRDDKAIFGSIEYRWPVHENVVAHAFLDVGRVAPTYSGLFEDPGGFAFGAGGGFLLGSEDSTFLVVDLAYGDGFRAFVSTDVFDAFRNRTEEL